MSVVGRYPFSGVDRCKEITEKRCPLQEGGCNRVVSELGRIVRL